MLGFSIFSGRMLGQEIRVLKLDDQINSSSYHEISPVLSRDGRTLYFTRVADPHNSKVIFENGKEYNCWHCLRRISFVDYFVLLLYRA